MRSSPAATSARVLPAPGHGSDHVPARRQDRGCPRSPSSARKATPRALQLRSHPTERAAAVRPAQRRPRTVPARANRLHHRRRHRRQAGQTAAAYFEDTKDIAIVDRGVPLDDDKAVMTLPTKSCTLCKTPTTICKSSSTAGSKATTPSSPSAASSKAKPSPTSSGLGQLKGLAPHDRLGYALRRLRNPPRRRRQRSRSRRLRELLLPVRLRRRLRHRRGSIEAAPASTSYSTTRRRPRARSCSVPERPPTNSALDRPCVAGPARRFKHIEDTALGAWIA